MSRWRSIDIELHPELEPSITRLVRHVYRQLKRPLKGGGNSMHWNQIQINYLDQQPHTTVINIAEGFDDAPGAMMIYSVNALTHRIKQKLKNNTFVALDTADFDQLLDGIIAYAHCQDSADRAQLYRDLAAQANDASTSERKELPKAHMERSEHAPEQLRTEQKRLRDKSQAETSISDEPEAKKSKQTPPLTLGSIVGRHLESEYKRAVNEEANKNVKPGLCKCNTKMESCLVNGCLSTYCPKALDSDDDDFHNCWFCHEVHCAHHSPELCVDCEKTLCPYEDAHHCGSCEAALCHECINGDHKGECILDNCHSDTDELSADQLDLIGDMFGV